jgi:hypothetical protein
MTENLADALGGFFLLPAPELAQPISQVRVLGHSAAKEDKLPAIEFLPRRSPLKPPSDAAGLFFQVPGTQGYESRSGQWACSGGMC